LPPEIIQYAVRLYVIVERKETISETLDREDQILQQATAILLIHRSGFFHAMNLEFGFGYPRNSPNFDETRWERLHAVAGNELQAFLGYLGRRARLRNSWSTQEAPAEIGAKICPATTPDVLKLVRFPPSAADYPGCPVTLQG
jgi:hypothetical protein